jgi:DNA-binding transcriptional LysR family regulator
MENLGGLAAFIESARAGSFTRAAANMAVSPQAVSGQVARLEAQLGARLFNRTTRQLALTDEGTRFLGEAERALVTLRDAAEALKSGGEPSGVVRMSTAAGFGRRFVVPVLPALRKRYPQLRIDLGLDDRKVDLVRDGYDLALRGGVIADSTLVARRICSFTGVLVASPAYLSQRGVPTHPDQLDDHDIVQLRFLNGTSAIWNFKVADKLVAWEPQAAIMLSDPEAIGEAAVHGLGIAQISAHHALPFLRTGKLKTVLMSHHAPDRREMVIHYPHREHLAARVKVTVEFLLNAFAANPDLHDDPRQLHGFAAS